MIDDTNPLTLRLENILTKKSDGATKLQDLAYTFDPVGNVTKIEDRAHARTQDFVYDDLNRLISAAGSVYGTQTFQYDAIGNMTSKAGRTMTYGVTPSTKPHAVTSVSGTTLPTFCNQETNGPSACTFDYDANGNMTKRGNDKLIYDSENRLKEMLKYEGREGTHTYKLRKGKNLISFTYLPWEYGVRALQLTI